MTLTVRTTSPVAGRSVVHVTGEVDWASVGRLRESLLAAIDDSAVSVVEADLSEVTFIDSSGIGALVAARTAADRADRGFVVTRASVPVVRVLRIVGVTQLLGLPGEDDPGSD